MKIQFLGAARQVTGSRYILDAGGLRLMVDCGLFQERAFRGRNWECCPTSTPTIDYVLLSHAHLDHTGLLPRLVGEGYGGPILTTPASHDLAEIILTDAAKIQEEDARFKTKRHQREGRQGPFPVEPLYTSEDVAQTMPLFETVRYHEPRSLNESVTVTYHDAGHILGSAFLEIAVRENGTRRVVLFSGDLGQTDKPIIRDPELIDRADYVVMESTYGDRDHPDGGDIADQLADVINDTVTRGGNIIIPTFAVERAQELIYHIGELVREHRIPRLMVFLDSPMAVDVTEVFRLHRECMDEQARAILDSGGRLFGFDGMNLVSSRSASKSINRIRGSCIIMAGSGMCTAGRIKHHLVANISRPENTVVFVGYQAVGTLGRELVSGAERVRIHGKQFEVKARIHQIHGLSAHADRTGLLTWIEHLASTPKRVFLTHGEEDAAMHLAGQIRTRRGWDVTVPQYRETHELP